MTDRFKRWPEGPRDSRIKVMWPQPWRNTRDREIYGPPSLEDEADRQHACEEAADDWIFALLDLMSHEDWPINIIPKQMMLRLLIKAAEKQIDREDRDAAGDSS